MKGMMVVGKDIITSLAAQAKNIQVATDAARVKQFTKSEGMVCTVLKFNGLMIV